MIVPSNANHFSCRNHRGLRHYWGLRVRGQHTKTTGRRGKTVGVSKKRWAYFGKYKFIILLVVGFFIWLFAVDNLRGDFDRFSGFLFSEQRYLFGQLNQFFQSHISLCEECLHLLCSIYVSISFPCVLSITVLLFPTQSSGCLTACKNFCHTILW